MIGKQVKRTLHITQNKLPCYISDMVFAAQLFAFFKILHQRKINLNPKTDEFDQVAHDVVQKPLYIQMPINCIYKM